MRLSRSIASFGRKPVRRFRLILLDACRENPFAAKLRFASRSPTRGGLAKLDEISADTLVAFAAKAGSISYDGDGVNSPYATALLRHLAEPGVDVRIALGRVSDEVITMTGGRQEPFIYGSLGGATISLVPQLGATNVAPVPPPPAPPPPVPAPTLPKPAVVNPPPPRTPPEVKAKLPKAPLPAQPPPEITDHCVRGRVCAPTLRRTRSPTSNARSPASGCVHKCSVCLRVLLALPLCLLAEMRRRKRLRRSRHRMSLSVPKILAPATWHGCRACALNLHFRRSPLLKRN
ncbi:caspase family protein (plasmid) [Bradyrhizobium sp. PMVTL-01]|uniref:caspase family protein n=1 Tax=Bradyrhizobium sp. PMVTL-01 TaxID=3434999 RepID=UPI003F7223DC